MPKELQHYTTHSSVKNVINGTTLRGINLDPDHKMRRKKMKYCCTDLIQAVEDGRIIPPPEIPTEANSFTAYMGWIRIWSQNKDGTGYGTTITRCPFCFTKFDNPQTKPGGIP